MKKDAADKFARVLATWFGCGFIPFAPGTAGTLAAVPVAVLWQPYGWPARLAFLLILTGAAIWAAGRVERILQVEDPSQIVIDEVAGFLLTMLLLPVSWLTLFLGFVFFRLFDILKPFPVRMLEKRFKGGWGVVADDLAAGVYAYLCVRLVLLLI